MKKYKLIMTCDDCGNEMFYDNMNFVEGELRVEHPENSCKFCMNKVMELSQLVLDIEKI